MGTFTDQRFRGTYCPIFRVEEDGESYVPPRRAGKRIPKYTVPYHSDQNPNMNPHHPTSFETIIF
jgi:hypothetical protein